MRRSLLFLLFFLLSIQLAAQSSCERNLNEARANYSSGNLYAIPGKLADCLEEGFSKTEKIDALRLLTLTYININQQEKARNTFIKLLNIKTDYQVDPSVDPAELYSLYRKIDTDIKYFIGVTAGLNLNDVRVFDSRHTNPIEANHFADYIAKVSYPQVGIQFLYPLTKNWVVGSEIQFQNQRFEYSETNYYENESNSPNPNDNFTTIEYVGSSNGINLNLNVRYMRDYYRWKPFIEFGTVGRYNFSYYLLDYTSNYKPTVEDEIIAKDTVTTRRSHFNIGITGNLGTMIKLGENYLEVKFGVSNYLFTHLNRKARETAYTYTLADGMTLLEDDYSNFVYQLNITFNLPFFDFQ